MSNLPVTPSLEIGDSVFNSLKALRGLISATSEDDVHIQAVLAAEQFGACVPVSPERIDEAVDALGGQNSVRVENLKASIGIASGGLCKIMRQSTPLLHFFMLCAACKMTLLDEECSTLMFEMLKTSQVLAKLPCSSFQILGIITQFSGQAGLIAPVDIMHEVASAVDEWNPSPRIFQGMDVKVLAELLVTLFERMRDETADSVILVGHRNCIWLASSLLWLFGDKACLLINHVAIRGHPGAKLYIHIDPVEDVPWIMQVFKASEDPTKFVFEMSADEMEPLSQVPLRSLKSLVDQHYWGDCQNSDIRRKAMLATGIIAQTLVSAISQRGLLYLSCGECENSKHCNEAALADLAHPSWLAETERIVTRYGWSVKERAQPDPGLLATILEGVDTWRRRNKPERTYEAAASSIRTPCLEFINSYIHEGHVELDHVLGPALFVAADAAITCTAFFQSGARFIKPWDEEMLQSAERRVILVLSDGLEVTQFRNHAIKQLLPGLDTCDERDLVVASGGYVAGMDILWTESPRQSDALSIRVQRGQIKKDRGTYHSIRETFVPVYAPTFTDTRVPAFDAVSGLVTLQVGWQHPIKDWIYSFETSASTFGTKIEVKHRMTHPSTLDDPVSRREASWRRAIMVLATATHMDFESQMTALSKQSLEAKLTKDLQAENVCWIDSFYSPGTDPGMRTLMRTGGDKKVKIFGAGICRERRDVCCHVVIRHRSPLLQCIERAESSMPADQTRRSWVIVD